jgi:hypothetical protein
LKGALVVLLIALAGEGEGLELEGQALGKVGIVFCEDEQGVDNVAEADLVRDLRGEGSEGVGWGCGVPTHAVG